MMSKHMPYKLEPGGTSADPLYRIYEREVLIAEFKSKQAAEFYFEGLRTGWIQSHNNYEAIKEAGEQLARILNQSEFHHISDEFGHRLECISCDAEAVEFSYQKEVQEPKHNDDCQLDKALANWKAVNGEGDE